MGNSWYYPLTGAGRAARFSQLWATAELTWRLCFNIFLENLFVKDAQGAPTKEFEDALEKLCVTKVKTGRASLAEAMKS